MQKRYFLETLTDNETYPRHRHNAQVYTYSFRDQLNDEPALFCFEVLSIALIAPHIIRLFLFNIEKALVLSQAKSLRN